MTVMIVQLQVLPSIASIDLLTSLSIILALHTYLGVKISKNSPETVDEEGKTS